MMSTSAEWDFLLPDVQDEVYDRETVELLQAEIDDLRAMVAQKDAHLQYRRSKNMSSPCDEANERLESDRVSRRLQELVDEANRADERVMILEEMLHAAEDANRADLEERTQLQAWVGDIEKRVGRREQEHQAEKDAMRERLESSNAKIRSLLSKLQESATDDQPASNQLEQTIEELQTQNQKMESELATSQRENRDLKQRLADASEHTSAEMREERAKIAREFAEVSRLKFEFTQRIFEQQQMKSPSDSDQQMQQVLDKQRAELRQMREARSQEESTLSGRLRKLWKRVEADRI